VPAWNIGPAQWIDSLTSSLEREERDRARIDFKNILNAAARLGQWDASKTGVITGEFVDPSGHVRLDAAGVHVYSDTAETIWLKSIGDMLIGSNISAAATTNFVFLSTDQTYNSEALGAGDLLIGDNSASKANMLWDASAGILYFRGGTTNQVWISTTGSLVAGAGDVTIDSTGISILTGTGDTNTLTWRDSVTSDSWGRLYTSLGGTSPDRYGNIFVQARQEGTGAPSLSLQVEPTSGSSPQFVISATDGGNVAWNQYPDAGGVLHSIFTRSIGTKDASGTSNGFGGYEQWSAATSTGASRAMANQLLFWTDATLASIDAAIVWSVASGGTQSAATTTLETLRLGADEAVFNEQGRDYDFRVEGDTATNLTVHDGGLDAFQIGTTVAGAIADFRATSIVFNENSADMDVRFESNGNANMFVLDGGLDAIGIGAVALSGFTLRVAADGAPVSNLVDFASDTAADQGLFIARRARTSLASPSAVASGDVIGGFQARGYQSGGAYSSTGPGLRAAATANWTATVQSARLEFYATPGSSATPQVECYMQNGVIFGVPTGTFKGLGTLNVAGAYYVNGSQVVGARVVDARADDVVDTTYGAEEAGVLDALRDAMITHGLIAAA